MAIKNKSGLSQVVSTLILILLVVAAVAVAATALTGFVRNSLNNAGACRNVLDQVKFNPDYTCYDVNTNTLVFSVSRQDFDMDSLTIAVSDNSTGKTFVLTDKNQSLTGIINYKTKTANVVMPPKESGQTYCLSSLNFQPTTLQMSPKVSGVQCSVTDTINSIPTCSTEIVSEC